MFKSRSAWWGSGLTAYSYSRRFCGELEAPEAVTVTVPPRFLQRVLLDSRKTADIFRCGSGWSDRGRLPHPEPHLEWSDVFRESNRTRCGDLYRNRHSHCFWCFQFTAESAL